MIQDVYPNDLIKAAAEELKKVEAIQPPAWTPFVKTGAHKERPPFENDWWYTRVAAVLRSVQILGPIGVAKLRVKYGGKKRRGHQPPEFRKGSGNIIRKCLQQLEKAGFVQKAKADKKGRVISPQGQSFLDKIAVQLVKQKPRKKIVSEEQPKEASKQEKPKTKEVPKKEEKPEPKEAPKPEAPEVKKE